MRVPWSQENIGRNFLWANRAVHWGWKHRFTSRDHFDNEKKAFDLRAEEVISPRDFFFKSLLE